MNKPKYSIIIPVNNVINYLPATIESIISQNYTDYELIISDDNSTDGTAEYIDSLNHPNIKVLHTISRLTMAAHFDWAQTHASGQWQMFVGGDDGLQPYFFQLADMLTEIAAKKNIRTIASRRAYFFWNGCQSDYGDVAVSYSVTKKYRVKSSKKEMYRCLYSKDDYFNLPQMYTTSLFHKTLIDQMRQMQNAKFLTYGISDANMAAISVSMEKRFLYSEIPLGWVGTSPKVLRRSDDFIKNIKLHSCCGNYRLGFMPIYFWGALLTLSDFNRRTQTKLLSKRIIENMVANAYIQLNTTDFINSNKYDYFLEFLNINNLKLERIKKKVISINRKNRILAFFYTIVFFPWRCISFVLRRIPLLKKYFIPKDCSVYVRRTEQPHITLETASETVMKLVSKNLILVELIV